MVKVNTSTGALAGHATGGNASVALQDKLSRCEQQLGDWQACPSRKTPEGKKIIQDLQTQIRNLESRMASTGSLATSSAQQPDTALSTARAAGTASTAGNDRGMLGRNLDVFAYDP